MNVKCADTCVHACTVHVIPFFDLDRQFLGNLRIFLQDHNGKPVNFWALSGNEVKGLPVKLPPDNKGQDRVVKGQDRVVKGQDRGVKGQDRVVKGQHATTNTFEEFCQFVY